MGRRRSRRRARSAIANASLSNRRMLRVVPVDLRSIEDRRRYHPLRDSRRTMMRTARATESLRLQRRRKDNWRLMNALSFVAPRKVVTCVRRKTRREVMFATGGVGKRQKKTRRRSWRSKIRC